MIISKTPYRMSFFGGGTDFPDYYREYGGAVLSSTFNRYSFVTIRHLPAFFAYKNQFTYSQIERFNSPDEVEHPLMRAALKEYGLQNVQIAYDADMPARSGIGSSSVFAVGLVNSILHFLGQDPDKKELAERAVYLERVLCGEAGGVQDQYAAAYGGFNRMDFSDKGVTVTPVDVPPERLAELNSRILLVFSGFQRLSYEISQEQNSRIKSNLRALGEIRAMVDEGEKILKHGDLDDFGLLLNESWLLKKTLSNGIATPEQDFIYDSAISAGALGGKLLGAGGGGFFIFYVDPDKRRAVTDRLGSLLTVPFGFEKNGSEIIHESEG